MADEASDLEFLSPKAFEWDDRKCALNLAKHAIDFDDATDVFYGPIILRRSDRNNEERWTALGYSEDRLVVVVFAMRANVIRIISARRARKNEEREYRNAKVGRSPQG
ncbi:BrnT family toxin [Bradyrhizobium sp. CCBAU 53415]|uniref:BrnT family toxin n=1 Tax=Bradyrhizobium sp. CCBAU 53415 TaxID=1325119 RepID=UPI002305C43B|nr:BrnT family toxin [Bradyrhizobium sp. CCBAU 53415]